VSVLPSARVVRVRKASRDMERGLVWVEAYLPFDVAAFSDFTALIKQHGTAQAAAKADPELARKALEPLDSQGEAMLADDLEKLAHCFVVESRKMDVQHDQRARGTVQLVESFLNGPEVASPNFWPGAWVTVFEVQRGSAEWTAIEKGDLNAVSFQADVFKFPVIVTESP
jgi:hypothetical protein